MDLPRIGGTCMFLAPGGLRREPTKKDPAAATTTTDQGLQPNRNFGVAKLQL